MSSSSSAHLGYDISEMLEGLVRSISTDLNGVERIVNDLIAGSDSILHKFNQKQIKSISQIKLTISHLREEEFGKNESKKQQYLDDFVEVMLKGIQLLLSRDCLESAEVFARSIATGNIIQGCSTKRLIESLSVNAKIAHLRARKCIEANNHSAAQEYLERTYALYKQIETFSGSTLIILKDAALLAESSEVFKINRLKRSYKSSPGEIVNPGPLHPTVTG